MRDSRGPFRYRECVTGGSKIMPRNRRTAGTLVRQRRLSRRMPRMYAREMRQYALRIGLTIWAWNSLHASMFQLFWFLVSADRVGGRALAHGMWHAIQNDSAQRQMVREAAIATLASRPKLRDNVLWAVASANVLGGYRNIAAHTAATFNPLRTTIPSADWASTRTPAMRKFEKLDHTKFWGSLAADLRVLSSYVSYLAHETHLPGVGPPLPRRPKLQSLAPIRQIEAQINQDAQIAAQALPKSPSQPKGRKATKRT